MRFYVFLQSAKKRKKAARGVRFKSGLQEPMMQSRDVTMHQCITIYRQRSKLNQKSCQSCCLESQIINIRLKKSFKKVPGPPPKLSASGWRTGSNLEHCIDTQLPQYVRYRKAKNCIVIRIASYIIQGSHDPGFPGKVLTFQNNTSRPWKSPWICKIAKTPGIHREFIKQSI